MTLYRDATVDEIEQGYLEPTYVVPVEPTDRFCDIHGATESPRMPGQCWQKANGYVDGPHGTKTECVIVDVVRVTEGEQDE